MAKKKKDENALSYLQMPLPTGRRYSKMTKVTFGGLNKKYTIDTGELSKECNISTEGYPYLTPSKAKIKVLSGYSKPISMFAFDDFILVVYRDNTAIKIDYIDYIGDEYVKYTGTLKADGATSADETTRSIVQFNAYKQSKDIVNGEFDKRILIFPDKKSMFFELNDLLHDENNKTDDSFILYDMDSADGSIVTPPIKYATVHLSRVFGVSDDCVFASGFNDYTNWALDTVGDSEDEGYNESNAWM